jgi:hypothetical protein
VAEVTAIPTPYLLIREWREAKKTEERTDFGKEREEYRGGKGCSNFVPHVRNLENARAPY